MREKTTPASQQLPKEKDAQVKRPCVSEKTLLFLRSFASNYYVEHQLPQGLQGIILG